MGKGGRVAPAVDLYWIRLGAGAHVVRLSGRLYEALKAFVEHRERLDPHHSALQIDITDGRFVIESAPIPNLRRRERGVVAEGPVGMNWLGLFRLFRYEIRRWQGGVIPDLTHAVSSPVRVAQLNTGWPVTARLMTLRVLGVRSSRQLERRCQDDIAFRVLAANQTPDHVTIARFRAGSITGNEQAVEVFGDHREGRVHVEGVVDDPAATRTITVTTGGRSSSPATNSSGSVRAIPVGPGLSGCVQPAFTGKARAVGARPEETQER